MLHEIRFWSYLTERHFRGGVIHRDNSFDFFGEMCTDKLCTMKPGTCIKKEKSFHFDFTLKSLYF